MPPKAELATENILETLQRLAREKNLQAHSLLFQEADRQTSLFLVQSGLVELAIFVPGRGQTPILTVGPGELIAWSALLGKHPMTCSAKAITDCTLLEIPVDSIDAHISKTPEFGSEFYRWIATGLAHRLTATRLQLLDLFQHPNA